MLDFNPPDVRLVTAAQMKTLAGGDERVRGCYVGDGDVVYIADGYSDADTRLTLFHEATHAYEHRKGWMHSEAFANESAEHMMAQWDREQANQPNDTGALWWLQ